MRTYLAGFGMLWAYVAGYGHVHAAPYGTGRHYIVAFPDTVRHLPHPTTPDVGGATFIIFAQQRTRVKIVGPGIDRWIVVDSASSKSVQIPTSAAIYLDAPDSVVKRTFEIVADNDIILYAFFVTDYGAEGFTPLPVEQ